MRRRASTARARGLRRPRYRRSYKSKGAWQAAARRQVALPRNYSTSKTCETVLPGGNGYQTLNEKKMQPQGLINITRGDALNQRERDTIYISGIQIKVNYVNLRGTQRIWVNWAVVYPKRDRTMSATQKDFFRDYNAERSWDANAATKTGLSWSCAAVNTDEFVVLKRGKFLLTPSGNSIANYNHKDPEKILTQYVKIGRMFTFDGAIEAVDQQIYMCTWTAVGSTVAGYDVAPACLDYRMRAVVYYREPKTA